ncbi:hypothetical protein OK348_02655 [Flavobacterium sp. MXW15]|uniref:DUF2946 domain-containing protein n=1 Tax=Xanthomonas chitinilytica TaxID=2989819 RepID=A0ABT3JRY6_9XANT|nr:hypothetical protein [Xanthomonas sp. H13-6]MCW4453695.1 hypothetical protein [Flavobacterium sp. MXW15]MCW4471254.1 hypothetical protein [Xanthomonas sp. H13-6]
MPPTVATLLLCLASCLPWQWDGWSLQLHLGRDHADLCLRQAEAGDAYCLSGLPRLLSGLPMPLPVIRGRQTPPAAPPLVLARGAATTAADDRPT